MTSPSDDDDSDDQHRFRRLLLQAKAEGCRVLVTGDVGADVLATRSRRLFGQGENRHRLFAATALGTDSIRRHLPETVSIDDQDVELIRLGDIRSVDVTETYSTPPHIDDDNEFAAFRWRVVDAIARHRADHSPDPGELRVGVAPLAPLLDQHRIECIDEFVRVVGRETVRSNGMAHFHLGLDASSDLAAHLLPEMDVHIQLRRRTPRSLEHRWILLRHNVHTDWLPLQE
ncbi:hypothetical protein ACFPYI_00775 [Halomarina salina]|uniref:Uncharacterized protein n=1 Tax=Halomarina salina TaxID=1872699 RepID=A0ABD5RHR5_9EURY|nr:hypothetical protein [Halomarina salina]